MQNQTNYLKQARVHPRKVFFTGATALVEGQGVCYDRDYYSSETGEAVTDPCALRDKRVALPDQTNNLAFAGVTAKPYTAKTAGQWIEIYEPGSVCKVAVGIASVINSTILGCSCGDADPGRFTRPTFPGRGAALALETETNVVADAVCTDGTWSVSTVTVTDDDTADSFANVVAGDILYIEGGTGAGVTAGAYTVASVTSDNVIVLASSAGTGQVTGYVTSGNPTILAQLLDGEESGLQEVVSPSTGAAVAAAVGGMTYIAAGYTMAADSTHTLADGTRIGMKKGFNCLGTLTTKDYIVTVTNGIQKDRATALATLAFDADAEDAILSWHNTEWIADWTVGVTIA